MGRLGSPVELRDVWEILARRWWLVVAVPLLVGVLLLWRAREMPYQVSVRATVLIPGDTEVPGSAERPELMVLDDLPPLVRSWAFAEGVLAELGDRDLTVDDVRRTLAGERYSRVLTVTVTHEDPARASAIGAAVAASLPALVNRYLIADGGAPATVRIIDPPGQPTRSRPYQAIRGVVLLVVAAGVGAGLALLAHALDPRVHTGRDVARELGAPVLADLRRRAAVRNVQ